MATAVENVAELFNRLSDDDIRSAAQHPKGFPKYVAAGAGRQLILQTEEDLTPFTSQLIRVAAEVFADLAPQSGRFAPAALIRLLNQVDLSISAISGVHAQIDQARMELAKSGEGITERVDALHPKIDRILKATEEGRLPLEASSRPMSQGR